MAAAALATWALLDVCVLSVPLLTLAMYLLVSPLPHAKFPRLAPIPLFYTLAWALAHYLWAAVPHALHPAAASTPAQLMTLLGLDLSGGVGVVRTDNVVLAVALQTLPILALACVPPISSALPNSTPNDASLSLGLLPFASRTT